MGKFKLDIELYYEDGEYKACINDNIGGNGIEFSSDSVMELTEDIAPYLYDYISDTNDDDEE